tara:strand:- start:210 stop:1277 length:1068 start_codon:yes stop_codon:yes gene_type:complete
VSTGTIASGGNLGLDSNNKIVKATEASGDLTSIVAGTGLSGTSLTGPIPTLNVDASQTQITSVGTITTGTWRGTAVGLDSGGTGLVGAIDGKIVIADGSGAPVLLSVGSSTAIEILGTIGTGVWNATAIASAKMATASDSAQGAVELATTAEADTGTDTARAVTPAGLKSHVDTYARKSVLRHSAFYLNDVPMVQNNLYFGNNQSNQPWNWNDPAPLTSQTDAAGAGVSGIIGDPDGYTFTIANHDENWGILLPFDISKVEVQCSMRPNLGTGDDITTAIYTGIRSSDSSAVLTLTKVAHTSVNHSGTANRYTQCDVAVTADYSKGTMIYVGVGSEDSTDMKQGRGYMTITVTER